MVDGYNDDPREIFEISEVRAFIKGLDAQWPYWFFFLSQADDSIKLLESCLCDTIEVIPGVASIDLDQMERALARHFGSHEPPLRGAERAGGADRGNLRGDRQPHPKTPRSSGSTATITSSRAVPDTGRARPVRLRNDVERQHALESVRRTPLISHGILAIRHLLERQIFGTNGVWTRGGV